MTTLTMETRAIKDHRASISRRSNGGASGAGDGSERDYCSSAYQGSIFWKFGASPVAPQLLNAFGPLISNEYQPSGTKAIKKQEQSLHLST